MIVYHGSKMVVDKPDVFHSRERVDFGKGFYVTDILDQAKKWCEKHKQNGNIAILNTYSLDDSLIDSYNVKRFESYSEEWLDFVMACRTGKDNSDYDIIYGGVANDKVFDTIELYMQNLIDKKTALGRLIYEKPNNQICIRTQHVIDSCLRFERSEEL